MPRDEKSDGADTWKGSISLPADLLEFVDEEKGRYGQRSAVIQEALRLMRQLKEKQRHLKQSGQRDLQRAAKAVEARPAKRKQ